MEDERIIVRLAEAADVIFAKEITDENGSFGNCQGPRG